MLRSGIGESEPRLVCVGVAVFVVVVVVVLSGCVVCVCVWRAARQARRNGAPPQHNSRDTGNGSARSLRAHLAELHPVRDRRDARDVREVLEPVAGRERRRLERLGGLGERVRLGLVVVAAAAGQRERLEADRVVRRERAQLVVAGPRAVDERRVGGQRRVELQEPNNDDIIVMSSRNLTMMISS